MVFWLCFEKHCFSWYPPRDWTVVYFFFYPLPLLFFFPPLYDEQTTKDQACEFDFSCIFFETSLWAKTYRSLYFIWVHITDWPTFLHRTPFQYCCLYLMRGQYCPSALVGAPFPSTLGAVPSRLSGCSLPGARAASHKHSTTINVPLFTPFLMEGRTYRSRFFRLCSPLPSLQWESPHNMLMSWLGCVLLKLFMDTKISYNFHVLQNIISSLLFLNHIIMESPFLVLEPIQHQFGLWVVVCEPLF